MSGAAGTTSAEAGPITLNVVHGLSDGGRLFACLRDLSSGQDLPTHDTELQAGLEFGHNALLEVSWDVAAQTASAELFAAREGALPALGLGLQPSCADLRRVAGSARAAAAQPSSGAVLDAGTLDAAAVDAAGLDSGAVAAVDPAPNGLVALGSVALAAGSLHAGGHYALVATGCAAAVAESAIDAGCGAVDVLTGARVSELLVEFATGPLADPAYLGLQFLNASRPIGRADLLLQGQNSNQPPIGLASQVPFGALRPASATAVEVPLAVELRGGGGAGSVYVQSWSDTLAASGLDSAPPNHDYLLLFVGPNPGLAATALPAAGLTAPRLVLVAAD